MEGGGRLSGQELSEARLLEQDYPGDYNIHIGLRTSEIDQSYIDYLRHYATYFTCIIAIYYDNLIGYAL